VHASFALREKGYEAIMINSNPETVSTDYDTSSKLYFEPLTLEDVLAVYHAEGCSGAIVQFGGQTPLNLALELKENGVHILGTSPEALHKAEDRSQFKAILDTTGLLQPANQTALCAEEAYEVAGTLGFPVLIRPSFVLGGRGMFIVHTLQELKQVVREAFDVAPGKPVLIEQYLENAIEVDVDCLSDGSTCVIGGILEHIEYAGVHSGDATLVLPTYTLSPGMLQRIRQSTEALAKALGVIGLMNVQYAIQGDKLYVLEVNPRASRTVPFVSKAIGVPLAKYAARVMSGETLEQIGFTQERVPGYWAVKESVFPFARFPGSHIILSPEMKSTGEVMGIDASIGMAFAKAKMAAQPPYPTSGNAFLSVRDADKAAIVPVAQSLVDLGFQLYATRGTAEALREQGLVAQELFKISEGARPNVEDLIKNDAMHLIINTATGAIPHRDESAMRYLAIQRRVCMIMTLSGAQAAVTAIRAQKSEPLTVKPIQAYYTA
jgi:carbamoyl-phosphate synthase large subunit